MTIQIEYETEIALGVEYRELIERVVNAAADYEGCPYEAIREMNRDFRQIDAPTDVLSFPAVAYEEPSGFGLLEEDDAGCFNPDTGELLLGDIVISVERVIAQAEEYGHSRERELGFLTAHSMLHLFGYDHIGEDERAVMERRQEEILDGLGLKRPV